MTEVSALILTDDGERALVAGLLRDVASAPFAIRSVDLTTGIRGC